MKNANKSENLKSQPRQALWLGVEDQSPSIYTCETPGRDLSFQYYQQQEALSAEASRRAEVDELIASGWGDVDPRKRPANWRDTPRSRKRGTISKRVPNSNRRKPCIVRTAAQRAVKRRRELANKTLA